MMGWTSSNKWKTKTDIINAIVNEHCRIRTFQLRGNELWTVQNVGNDSIIVLYLLEKEGKVWAYKDIDESMGPCYYKCPIEFLDCASEKNVEWRNKVRGCVK